MLSPLSRTPKTTLLNFIDLKIEKAHYVVGWSQKFMLLSRFIDILKHKKTHKMHKNDKWRISQLKETFITFLLRSF